MQLIDMMVGIQYVLGAVPRATRPLRRGRLDPRAGSVSLAKLVVASASPKDALWVGSPDVCPATRRLVHDAMGTGHGRGTFCPTLGIEAMSAWC